MAEKRYFLLKKDKVMGSYDVVKTEMAHTKYEAALKMSMPSSEDHLLVGPKKVWIPDGSSIKPYSEKVVKLCITVRTDVLGGMLI